MTIGTVSIEFWGLMQIIIDMCLIGLFVVVIMQIRSSKRKSPVSGAEGSMETVEGVLREAHEVAKQFDLQLKEKQQIIKRINDGLDSKIVGINLLMNRAESVLKREENLSQQEGQSRDICELQEEILALSDKGLGADMVSRQLGVAKAEVELVMSLRRKFNKMGEG